MGVLPQNAGVLLHIDCWVKAVDRYYLAIARATRSRELRLEREISTAVGFVAELFENMSVKLLSRLSDMRRATEAVSIRQGGSLESVAHSAAGIRCSL